MTTMATSAISLNGLDLIVALHTQQDPAADEWQVYLDLEARTFQRSGSSTANMRNLVITDGGAPNAKQRGQLAEIYAGQSIKTAVITTVLTNPVKRGIATAFGWINPAFKALPPDDWRAALKHLDVQDDVQTILLEFAKLQARLLPNSTLTLVTSSSSRRVA